MYTIKVKSVLNNTIIPLSLKDIFREKFLSQLSQHRIKVKGVSFFQDRIDFWCVHGFRRLSDTGEYVKMGFTDWFIVNETINQILDGLEVNAYVQTDSYYIRKGMIHIRKDNVRRGDE